MSSENSQLPELIDDAAAQTRGEKAHLTIAAAVRKIEAAEGARSVLLFEHGSLQIKMYAPRNHDAQTPHALDEIYVIAQGKRRRTRRQGEKSVVANFSFSPFPLFSFSFFPSCVFAGKVGKEKRRTLTALLWLARMHQITVDIHALDPAFD